MTDFQIFIAALAKMWWLWLPLLLLLIGWAIFESGQPEEVK